MSNIPSTARVIIIGGGIVGVSCLFHLAKAGCRDCILIEKNELTAGSTWHAAGNVPTFSATWSVMNMQRYSTELYQMIGAEVDYPLNYNVTGSLRLSHSHDRMKEFHQVKNMGRYQGIEIDILGVDQISDHYPFIKTHDLYGALYDPNDGDIDPAQLTLALAKGARELGASIFRFTPAIGIERKKGEWIVKTNKGDIHCEYLVNAAGYYAQRIGEWFKPYGARTVPLMVMSHQYLLFEEVSEIKTWSSKVGHKLPILRDVDSSYYLRQEKNGFNLGPYERNCRAHWVTADDPMPEDFSFQLYPDDLDRIEWYIQDAIARVPILSNSGVYKVINGPIPYTPDGMPLIGPMPGVQNAFEACGFTFGIAQGGGAGKVLAEWVTEGETEWDMWSCDPRRFTDYTDGDYCVAKGMEVYGHEYAMHFPWHTRTAGRNKKLSPVHDQVIALGGQMGPYNGWERANWFALPEDDTTEELALTWNRAGPWEKRIKEECEAVRDHCGVIDLPGFSRFWIQGDGAEKWLRGFCTGGMPDIGYVNLIYVSDSRGHILSEFSCIRLSEDNFVLISAASAQWHDRELILSCLPTSINLRETTTERDTILVTGPNSRKILSGLTDADLSQKWLSHQFATVAGSKAFLIRMSFAGELGWEIHAENQKMPVIYDAIIQAGVKPFGMWALNSLRLEKGYRTWKGDLSTDYSMFEGGLDRYIKLNKPEDFSGKKSLLIEKQKKSKRRFVRLIVDTDSFDAPYMSTLWYNGEVVGEITSGAWGYRVNASVALAILRADLAKAGTEIEVEIYENLYKATVQKNKPLWDPGNERLRA